MSQDNKSIHGLFDELAEQRAKDILLKELSPLTYYFQNAVKTIHGLASSVVHSITSANELFSATQAQPVPIPVRSEYPERQRR